MKVEKKRQAQSWIKEAYKFICVNASSGLGFKVMQSIKRNNLKMSKVLSGSETNFQQTGATRVTSNGRR